MLITDIKKYSALILLGGEGRRRKMERNRTLGFTRCILML